VSFLRDVSFFVCCQACRSVLVYNPLTNSIIFILRYMFDEKRKMTSIVYLTSLGTSITVCFIPMPTGAKIGILVLCKLHLPVKELNGIVPLISNWFNLMLYFRSVDGPNVCLTVVHAQLYSLWKSDSTTNDTKCLGNGWRVKISIRLMCLHSNGIRTILHEHDVYLWWRAV
jgi:hypothetical protein